MKKIFSLILALTLVLTMTACGGKKQEETVPAVEAPASALEILETVWAMYGADEKFAVIGGDMGNPVNDAPGSYNLADENISYTLLIPAEQLGNVTEAASMMHMMNANNFTCGVFRLAEGGLELIEIAPGLDLEKDILAHLPFRPLISADLKEMPWECFDV